MAPLYPSSHFHIFWSQHWIAQDHLNPPILAFTYMPIRRILSCAPHVALALKFLSFFLSGKTFLEVHFCIIKQKVDVGMAGKCVSFGFDILIWWWPLMILWHPCHWVMIIGYNYFGRKNVVQLVLLFQCLFCLQSDVAFCLVHFHVYSQREWIIIVGDIGNGLKIL